MGEGKKNITPPHPGLEDRGTGGGTAQAQKESTLTTTPGGTCACLPADRHDSLFVVIIITGGGV